MALFYAASASWRLRLAGSGGRPPARRGSAGAVVGNQDGGLGVVERVEGGQRRDCRYLPQAEVAGRRGRVCVTAGLAMAISAAVNAAAAVPPASSHSASSALRENTPDALVMAAAGTAVTGSASAGPGSGRAGLERVLRGG